MERVRIGLLGAGRMGRNHARADSTMRHADLVGIYDPVAEASRKLAAQYEVTAFTQLDEMLDAVDAVSIATPTPTHRLVALSRAGWISLSRNLLLKPGCRPRNWLL